MQVPKSESNQTRCQQRGLAANYLDSPHPQKIFFFFFFNFINKLITIYFALLPNNDQIIGITPASITNDEFKKIKQSQTQNSLNVNSIKKNHFILLFLSIKVDHYLH